VSHSHVENHTLTIQASVAIMHSAFYFMARYQGCIWRAIISHICLSPFHTFLGTRRSLSIPAGKFSPHLFGNFYIAL